MRACALTVLVTAFSLFVAGKAAGEPADEQRAQSGSEGDKVLYQEAHGPERGYHDLLIKERVFSDFVLEADLRCPSSVTHFGLVFRYKDQQHFYRLVLRPQDKDFRVEKVIGTSNYASARHVAFPLRSNRWYHVRLVVHGGHVEVWMDGQRKYGGDGFDELSGGLAGVTVFDHAPVEFDNVRVTAVDSSKVLFQDDFNKGRLENWIVSGPDGVKGLWAAQPKVERVEPRKDFVEQYTFQVCPSTGRNQSMFEFPGIMKLRDGQLLTLFIEENQHGTPPWAAMPSSGKLWMARSTDLGRTWTTPTLFLDTPIDDRHAYTLQLANGDLLSFWWVQTVAFGPGGEFNYTARSTDGGLTWEDPVRFRSGKPAWPLPPKPAIRGGSSLTLPPIQLPDGTLAMAIHCLGSDNRPPTEIGLLRSRDNGRTWGDYSTIAFDSQRLVSFVEPAVVRLASGKWIVVTRTEIPINPGTTHPYKLGPNMICYSADEGRTWTKPARLSLSFTHSGSTNPFILQTATGVVVYAVNTGSAFSYDNGQTWVPQEVNFGYYPNLLEIAPGTLASLACGMGGKVISLAKPRPGTTPPKGTPTISEGPKPPPLVSTTPPGFKVREIQGMFRAIRVRRPRDRRISPLLARGELPVLAVARATTDDGHCIVAVLRDQSGSWTPPRLVAAASAVRGDPVLSQACDGTLLCMFPAGPEDHPTMMATTSRDGGINWAPPAAVCLEGDMGGFQATSPAVEDSDGSWLMSATLGNKKDGGKLGVFRSNSGGTTWRLLAECPQPAVAAKRLAEPSLSVTRDGRWVVAVRQAGADGKGRDVVVTVSRDHGKTWSDPRDTGLNGSSPEIVELLDDLFLLAAEGDQGQLRTAFTWDELEFFTHRDLACGYCVRLGGGKYLARGSGVDLAGQFNYLAQVPLSADEVRAVGPKATVRLPASDQCFHFKGDWKPVEGKGDAAAFVSGDSSASVEVEFDGPVVCLVHDRAPNGRLVGVNIDGKEHCPVDMKGAAKTAVSTCLAAELGPGRHKLTLFPLLRWRADSMTVRALEVAGK
ncbi:MAG: exo-alpha-sialidase [Planctomycetota bacterium]